MAGKTEEMPKLMVSSTVYGIETLLDQIFAALDSFGYDVWMSHKGTVPVDPRLNNFENCLAAVDNCDLFFGIITPSYGSGRETPDGLSITHRELLRAVEVNKPRWIVCHQTIMTARSLLNGLSYNGTSLKGQAGRAGLSLHGSKPIVQDLKVIDMFEAASLDGLPVADRKGNWVQPYTSDNDVRTYVSRQFEPIERNLELLADLRPAPVAPAKPSKKRRAAQKTAKGAAS